MFASGASRKVFVVGFPEAVIRAPLGAGVADRLERTDEGRRRVQVFPVQEIRHAIRQAAVPRMQADARDLRV